MATLEQALALAAQGFHVFPCIENSKLPAIDAWQTKATTNPDTIRKWWTDPVMGWEQDWNIGICTTRFNGSEALVVVDVDTKNGKNGYDSILQLELDGHELPRTRTQGTPSGGQHLVYRAQAAVRQGVDVLGAGLDVRSRGGFIVAAGSTLDAGTYVTSDAPVVPAPQWLIERCGVAKEAAPPAPAPSVDATRAHARAVHYLENEAPLALEGAGGDATTYQVAARLKDLGVPEADAAGLLLEHWNDRCQPPWPADELEAKAHNAYKYGKEAPGSAAPEADFKPIADPAAPSGGGKSPLAKLNDEYAFVINGGSGHILWETTDEHDRFKLEHLPLSTFHTSLASMKIVDGKREVKLTEQWVEWKGRRSYDGLVFRPGESLGPRWYNLWRGFDVQPAAPFADGETPRCLKDFLAHARDNVCNGDETLYRWLIGYFAHCVQRPGEKPLVALVFRGSKGTGKNALVERVGALFSNHFMVASDRRYLLGQFNSHMERCLMFVLDEAIWAGDKQGEGILKSLVTGSHHTIERKGKEPYKVDNKTRVILIGNEEWLVPATEDERRYAVFNVGDGRKQDRKFFESMRVDMEKGGYAYLLRYLLDFDMTGIDINAAPSTEGLLEQKLASLEPLEQWWLASLMEGRIQGSDFDGWPQQIEKSRLRDAMSRYWQQRRITVRVPTEISVGRSLKKCAPSVKPGREMRQGSFHYLYDLPSLEKARADWCRYIGHEVAWESD